MLELIGQTLDRYQGLEHLDDEYWGSNFKAFDPKFDRTIVIQVLSAQWLEKSKAGDYPLQAARAMGNWRHPGIVRVFDVCQTPTWTYLVREYLPGASLRQLLQAMRSQVKWVSLPEAFHLVIEICRALAHAHQRNILHGDLYPGNLFFRATPMGELPYQPVVVNLGLIKSTALHLVPTLPAYQTPEATTGGQLEKSADVYSLGILLYELATGQLPPVEDSGSTSRDENPIQSPSFVRPDLPEPLEQVILKAISLKPDDRYPDANTMASALDEIAAQIERVKTAPPGFKESISLLSTLQSSVRDDSFQVESPPVQVSQSKSSPTKDFPPSPEIDRTKDQIHVLQPDQDVYSVSMVPTGLTIGRGTENDLVIDHSSVSRYHARIDFDGKNYLVQDLKSLNGTYLENTRLAPGEPVTWMPGDNLRVGEVWLRLERAGQSQTTQVLPPEAAPTRPGRRSSTARSKTTAKKSTSDQLPETTPTFLRPDGSSIESNQVTLSAGKGWVGAFTDASNISVSPGNVVSTSVLLFNQSPKQDVFHITFQGLTPDWIPSPPQPIQVPANGRAEAQLHLRPPRSSEGKAGRHPVTLQITSQKSPDQSVELRLILTVTAFSQFSCELRPRQIPSGQLGQVLVHNRGNLPETYTVLLEDRQNELIFDPSQVKIHIPAGKTAIVEFRPSKLQPRWFGGEERHSFNAHVSSEGGQLQSHTGEFTSRSLIPIWAPIALTVICVVMACILIVFYTQLALPSRYADQTSEAGQTALALVYQYTSEAATRTAQSLVGANQATIQAATATAIWSVADDDQDNLANNLELLAGTKPDVADTDEDGLKDGEEINQWKTNPLVVDTDADGWNDGKEVEKGADPLKKDTDGDGILDSSDPNPLHAATKTPLVAATNTPVRSATPTRTSTLQPSNTPIHTSTPQQKVADLTISLNNGQATSVPGSNVVYTIQIENKGPGVVTNLQVVDMFPSSLTNLTWTCTASVNSKCQSPNGIANLNSLVDLDVNGMASFVVNGLLSSSATGLLINTANINTPSGITDPNMVDNLAIDTDTITPHVTLSISKTDGRTEIAPGQAISYTITITNSGPSTAQVVNIFDDFPGKLRDVSWTCTATPGSSCLDVAIHSGNVDTSTNIAPDGSASIIANGIIKDSATGTLSNTASISSPIDSTANNKSATDTTIIVTEADLSVEVIAPFTTTVTAPLTYTINLTNTGPSDAFNVSLTQSIPADTTFVSASPGSPACEALPDRVTCVFESLLTGHVNKVIVVLNAPTLPGPIVSQVEVEADQADPNPTNNSSTITVQIQ